MLTAYGPVKNTNLKPTDNVVIVGAGRIRLDGHTACQSSHRGQDNFNVSIHCVPRQFLI
jgi:D-arabinose 1-dehydrogenase-like Zn-dependent alcohol dehydrogenase